MFWALAFTVVTLAAVLRFGYVARTQVDGPIRADAAQYCAYAYNLANHGVFSSDLDREPPPPDSWRTIGYPIFVAPFLAAFGSRGFYEPLLYAQAFLATLVVLGTLLLARRFLPDWASLVAAGLVALEPHLVAMTSYILTETLFSLLLIAALYLTTLAAEHRGAWRALAAGLLWAAAYLVTPSVAAVPIAVLLTEVVHWRRSPQHSSGFPDRRWVRGAALMCAVAMLAPVAWAVRNGRLESPDLPPETGRFSG